MPNSKLKTVAWSVAALLIALVASGWILPREYPTEQTVTRSFVLDEDFTKVRKIMVRTNAAKEIVTMGGGSEFVEQQWQDGSVAAEGDTFGKKLLKNVLSADPDWELKLSGTLKLRTLDEYIGQNVVTLDQEVEIVPNHIRSEVVLVEGSDRLLDYAMSTQLARDGNQTVVDLKLMQKIKTDAPWFAHGIADRRVRASAEQTLENQEQAMRRLLAENADKAKLLPLR